MFAVTVVAHHFYPVKIFMPAKDADKSIDKAAGMVK
jgi:hypothetical protein